MSTRTLTPTTEARSATDAARPAAAAVRRAGAGQSAPVAGPATATIRRGLVACGLAAIAAIHLADLPGKMAEVPYLGWAYVGLIVASLVLAELVTVRSDRRLMAAAGGLSAAVLVGFLVNRTVGMPNAMDDIGNWTEPLAMISLLLEGAVAWLAARAWFARD